MSEAERFNFEEVVDVFVQAYAKARTDEERTRVLANISETLNDPVRAQEVRSQILLLSRVASYQTLSVLDSLIEDLEQRL